MVNTSRKIKHLDVLCIGHACYDLIFMVTHHFRSDEKGFASKLFCSGGGPAANAAYAVARLGLKAGFIGYLGKDAYGKKHLQEFSHVGVNTDLCVQGDFPTPLAVILVKPNGDRTVINYKKATPLLKRSQIENPIPFRPKVILFDGHEPEISLALLEFARRHHILTVLDAGSVHKGTELLLQSVDYVVGSEKFCMDFTGKKNVKSAINKLSNIVPRVVITLGKHGLIWKNREGRGIMKSLQVDVLDTTGAGDAFHGGFAAGLVNEMAWEDLLEFASRVAALCCTKVGARLGMPTLKEVEEYFHCE